MKVSLIKKAIYFIIAFFIIIFNLNAQQGLATHTRGKLWETINNNGLIGSAGAWDYLETTGLGFYPGFSGYYFPNDEQLANSPNKVTNANFHNFRSGPWIIAKDLFSLEPPDFSPKPKDFLMYHASLTPTKYGTITNYYPFVATKNFIGTENFNPLLPEEMYYTEIPTVTGITIKQRSMAWSYPGFSDFIIYDYVFKNTGDMVIPSLNKTMNYQQTLNEVWIVFHSGISVSTKGTLNFHYDPNQFLNSAAPAGGFGGYGGKPGSDIYHIEDDNNGDGKGIIFYSRDYNGGREPVPWDKWPVKQNWRDLLRLKPEWEPELQDPACFGWVILYRDSPQNSSFSDPFDADPTYFSVYTDEGDNFKGQDLDFNEFFGFNKFKEQFFYDFARHSYRRPNDGKTYAWYTASFGPYTLAPGDSVRLIIAEIAGQMDMKEIAMGDPMHHFPDSSISAIRRNVNAVRQAIKWGFGANINGINLAADVPEPPPAPNCKAVNASIGSDTAIIAIQWDKLAETTKISDKSGNIFYDGVSDLSGYRIFRTDDERGIWELLIDIPRTELHKYWNSEKNLYEYLDKDLHFGFGYYYYVQAYNSKPKTWISANGTVVNNLSELKSADYNRTPLTFAKPGPVDITQNDFNVFVVPNPYIEGSIDYSFGQLSDKKIEFRNLPERATIRIYNLAGELVKTLHHGPDTYGNLSGSAAWDQKSDSGLLVAPGLYIFVVDSETKGSEGKRDIGKFMIIR
ncbi:hypothetical protein VJY32_08225 [Ignavibacteria bacterium 4148-Me]|uniref:hypothetical protein n=1 Tax=Rosettibacter primus TaxID=3111523 RepID=UPI00336BEB9B